MKNQSELNFRMSTEKSINDNTKIMKSAEIVFQTIPSDTFSQQIITEKSINMSSTSKSAGLRTRPYTAINLRPTVSRFSQEKNNMIKYLIFL